MKRLFSILASIVVSAVLMSGVAQAQAEDTRIVMEAFKDSIQQNNSKLTINVVDPLLNIAEGNVEGYESFGVSGQAPSGIQTAITDIWDRADSSATQLEWTAPTQARLHNIMSSDIADDGDPAGTGTQVIRLSGLLDWDSGAVSELITMNGTSNVSTVYAYVIINDMEVVEYGTSTTGPNEGAITATAATDSTVSMVILAGEGKAHSTIYGIPSTTKAYLNQWYGSLNKGNGGASQWINLSLRVNEYSDTELTNFRIEETRGLNGTSTSYATWPFDPYLVVDGPAIIKVSGKAGVNDIGASGGYSGILIDNNNNSPNNLAASDGRLLQDTHGRFLLHDSN